MQRIFIITISLLVIGLYGCSGLKVNQDLVNPIDESFSGTYSNIPYKSDTRYQKPTLLELLNIISDSTESVEITLLDSTHIKISYYESLTKTQKKKIIEGYLSKKGYFEIYFRKHRQFIPLTYSSRDIDRIRIGKLKNGNLIVDNKWAKDGSFLLIFAGGASERFQSFFEKK